MPSVYSSGLLLKDYEIKKISPEYAKTLLSDTAFKSRESQVIESATLRQYIKVLQRNCTRPGLR
jgi:hypothetical protein